MTINMPPLPEPNDYGNMGHPEGWSADQMKAYARAYAKAKLEEAAKVCLVKVKREPGYNGQWEGYGSFETEQVGSECAAAIRKLAEEL